MVLNYAAHVHSSEVAEAALAWHSMPATESEQKNETKNGGSERLQRSIMWLRQIAQLSTTMSKKKKLKDRNPPTRPQKYPMPTEQQRSISSPRISSWVLSFQHPPSLRAHHLPLRYRHLPSPFFFKLQKRLGGKWNERVLRSKETLCDGADEPHPLCAPRRFKLRSW
jgi:hypothetical protein